MTQELHQASGHPELFCLFWGGGRTYKLVLAWRQRVAAVARKDPKEVIEAMVSIVPADTGLFRNVGPKAFEEFIKTDQKEAWENEI
jgi:hypothetical protein